MSSISVITSSLSFNLVICIRVAGTCPWKMMTGGQCSSRSCRLGVCNKLPLSSQLMWVSCTDALIMARWLFVPTSSAGQTRHPFCFGRVLISPKCCFFFSLSGNRGFPQQCEKILLGLLSATHLPCGLNPDVPENTPMLCCRAGKSWCTAGKFGSQHRDTTVSTLKCTQSAGFIINTLVGWKKAEFICPKQAHKYARWKRLCIALASPSCFSASHIYLEWWIIKRNNRKQLVQRVLPSSAWIRAYIINVAGGLQFKCGTEINYFLWVFFLMQCLKVFGKTY